MLRDFLLQDRTTSALNPAIWKNVIIVLFARSIRSGLQTSNVRASSSNRAAFSTSAMIHLSIFYTVRQLIAASIVSA